MFIEVSEYKKMCSILGMFMSTRCISWYKNYFLWEYRTRMGFVLVCIKRHFSCIHFFFKVLGPPNFGLSRQ